MTFTQRIMLSMLAILLLSAIVNGLLVYKVVSNANKESVKEYGDLLTQGERSSISSWLDIAESVTNQYVILANQNPDSAGVYKARVLKFLKEMRWDLNAKNDGYFFVFGARTGDALLFRDSLGNFISSKKNVLDMEDANKKKFVKEIRDNAFSGDSAVVAFRYSKLCLECVPTERIGRGIFIRDWDWVIGTGTFSSKIQEQSGAFAQKFNENQIFLMQNLFGIMLISFLVGLFLVFRQMNAFTTPLKTLSVYLHQLASEGLRYNEFKLVSGSQSELTHLATDINSIVRNVGKSMEEVHMNADRVSDLSGACTDMLDIVDYDAKLVGQRTSEMRDYSKDVIKNVASIATGIEEINANLDGLKKLTSRIAESASDIKASMAQMSDAMRELNEKAKSVQNSAIYVVQAVSDMGIVSSEELIKISDISEFVFNMSNTLGEMTNKTSTLRLSTSQSIGFLNKATENLTPEQKDGIKNVSDTMSSVVEELHNEMVEIQTKLSSLQDNQVTPLQLVVEERKNLSNEIASEIHELDTSIEGVVSRISEINTSSQYINSNVRFVSSDINEAYRNLEEIVNATDNMSENSKIVNGKMNDFSEKSKRVKEAHAAIAHTILEAKVSMKNLNDLSANLRKVVDNLMHIENKKSSDSTMEMEELT